MDKIILKQKLNKHLYGLLLGLILPLVVVVILSLFRNREVIGIVEYIKYLHKMGTLLPVLSVATLINLVPFYLFKRLDMWYFSKGVVFSVFLYLVFIVVLKFANPF